MPHKTSLEELYRHLHINIYWKDLEGKYQGCNDVAAASVNMLPEQLIGKTDFDIFSKDVAALYQKNDRRVLAEKRSIVFSETAPTFDGSGYKHHVISTKTPQYDKNGRVCGIVGVTVDVTKIKQLEENLLESNERFQHVLMMISSWSVQEANTAKDDHEKMVERLFQFIQDQEHDIRTPISGIVMSAQNLQGVREQGMDLNSDFVGDIIESMNASGTRLMDYQESVLFDLYDDSSKGRSIFESFNLGEITKAVFELNLCTAELKKLEYTYKFDNSIPKYLKSDSKKVYQCLMEVIGNAVKFTETGFVRFSTKLLKLDDRTAHVLFIIEDSGIGIPEDKKNSIYQEYVKVERSNLGGEHGRGLGLTRVVNYVESINGEVDLDSTVNKGSTFRLILPFTVSLDQDR